jgi:hypothetical protein
MKACRSGISIAKTMDQTASSTTATTKLSVTPTRTRSTTLIVPPRSSAWVRREKRRRTRETISPPTICAPATIAAASPAIP